MTKKGPKQIDWHRESKAHWEATAKRVKRVRIEADEDFSNYRLMDGVRCIYAWSERSPLGYELAHFLSTELLPSLRNTLLFHQRPKPSSNFHRKALYRPYILDELGKLLTKRNLNSSSLIHLVWENTCSTLKKLKLERRLPPEMKPSVSETYVRTVLKESGTGIGLKGKNIRTYAS